MNRAGDIADSAVSKIEQSFANLNPTFGGFASLGVGIAMVTVCDQSRAASTFGGLQCRRVVSRRSPDRSQLHAWNDGEFMTNIRSRLA